MGLFDLEQDIGNRAKVYGFMVGVVTALGKEENLGKVKVKLLNMTTSTYEIDFARVMTPMSGPDFGIAFFPEVGDEVLVGFAGGDLSQPYIIGSLWNKDRKFPLELKDEKNDIRQIKTKSGHTIIFNDSEDETAIEVKTKEGLSLKLDEKNQVVTILGDKDSKNSITISGKDGELSIKAENKIELVSGDSKFTLDGKGKSVMLESSGKLNLKGQNFSVEGSAKVDVKGNSGLNLESSGQTVLKGSIVKIN